MNPWKLPFTFLRIGALNELQYRVNFFMQILQSLISLGVGLVGLSLVFEHTTDLAGWSRPELLAVMGVYTLMGGIINATIQPNMNRLLGDVQEGSLDFALTKPVDSQLMVSVREFRVWRLVDVAVGAIVLGWAILELGQSIGLGQALAFGVALLLGALMIYSFWLILATGAFWVVRMDQIVELFQGIYQAGRWPVGIYPEWLRTGLTFLVPVAFAVTVPAEALTNRLDALTLLLTAIVAFVFLMVSRWFFRKGLRNYTGASA
jgi:ABC-2 type transport system permease protein